VAEEKIAVVDSPVLSVGAVTSGQRTTTSTSFITSKGNNTDILARKGDPLIV
jgi:hypothetical protein